MSSSRQPVPLSPVLLGLLTWMAIGALGCSSDGAANSTGAKQGEIGQPTACTIAAEGVTSSAIGTVGIVTFSVSGAASLDRAEIRYGLDSNFGLVAPVDVETAAANYRTLLLGMKENRTYRFQVVGSSGTATCTSPEYTITAGGCPTSVKRPKVTLTPGVDPSALNGGFLVMEGYRATTPDDYAYILDGDGDLVWCYRASGFGDLMATRMSWDGKYMWLVHGNTPEVTARMGRVSMDGLEFEDHSAEFVGLNHDAFVLPNDEGVVYIAYGSGGCDDIKEWHPDGQSRTIISAANVFVGSTPCHGNAIKYDSSDGTIVASDDSNSAYYKFDRQGNLKWILNGGKYNSFDKSGAGATTWTGQHNFHLLGTDAGGLYHILFFNNGTSSTKADSTHAVVREITLDLLSMTTQEVWTYDSEPDVGNPILGDVQRLDNGNTLVTYSLAGIIQEVDPQYNVLRQMTWSGASSGVGYVTARKSLYGPPPR